MNPRTRESFYTLWTVVILICLAVCVFVLAYVSVVGGGETVQTAPGGDTQPAAGSDLPGTQDQNAAAPEAGVPEAGAQDQPVQEAAQAPAVVSTVLTETIDLGQEYLARMVFLGDSTTYGLYAYGLLPLSQVWVPASGTLSLFNWAIETVQYAAPGDEGNPQTLSISDAAAAGQPEFLVITLGINGVSILDETEFKEYYSGLIDAVQAASPSTKIVCQSILPVIDSMTVDGIKNDQINAANGWILDLAQLKGLRYLSTRDALVDETGGLISSYNSGDGIHLNTDGYNALLQYVRTHAYQ